MRDEGTGKRRATPTSGSETFRCPHCDEVHPSFVSRCPDTGEAVDRAFKMQGAMLEGRYRVGRPIGRGGMGVVYEGRHVELGRNVAIKFLHADAGLDREMLARFENEARAAAAAGHRNIVQVLDLGETPHGLHYIVMERLDGCDLGAILASGARLAPGFAVEIAIQILSALRVVHAKGIVHRDLKPENVIITLDEAGGLTAKLVDFGLSKLGPPGTDGLTASGTVFGTPRYMPPEQALARAVDHRADIYSTGVILYRMLTGRLPHEADAYCDLIVAISSEEPHPISEQGVPLPQGLAEAVMRAIERDPSDRHGSAGDFFEAIRPFRSWTDEEAVFSSTPPPQPFLARDDVRLLVSSTGRARGTPSHVYSIKGSGSSTMMDVVGPIRPLRLPASTPAPEPPPRAATSGMTPRPSRRRGSADRWSLGEAPPAAPERTDSSISQIGWEETGVVRLSRRFPARTIAAVTLILLALAAGGSLIYIGVAGRPDRGAPPAARNPAPARAPAPAVRWSVDPGALPEGAEVFVDGVLHPERPVLVPHTASPHSIRVTASGYNPWERDVAVYSDIVLDVTMTPTASTSATTAPVPARPPAAAPPIDTVYPEPD